MKTNRDDGARKIVTDGREITIGNTSAPVFQTSASSKVPDILFYDVPQVHVNMLFLTVFSYSNMLNIIPAFTYFNYT